MAEIITSQPRSRTGFGKLKKRATNIDLTPMVDLGFLLITFFIFTTSMSQPTAMKLRMPHDALNKPDSMQTPASGAMSILLAGNNMVYYYYGILADDGSNVMASDYQKIRNVILQKKQTTKPDDFMILLKSSNQATYKNTVDMLDEMFINDIKKYALLDLNRLESKLID